MPVSTLLRLSELQADVLAELRDPAGVRFPPTRVFSRLVDALGLLAEEGALWRVDVIVPGTGVANYALGGVPAAILQATYDGWPLDPADEPLLFRLYGKNWRQRTGLPRHYLRTGRSTLRLIPTPTDATAGEALTFGAPTARTEEDWRGPAAHRMHGTVNPAGGAWVLWEPGDGQVTNEETAARLLRVRYTFQPYGLSENSQIGAELKLALQEYALWQELGRSRKQEDVALAPGHKVEWERRRIAIGNSMEALGDSPGSIDLVGACG